MFFLPFSCYSLGIFSLYLHEESPLLFVCVLVASIILTLRCHELQPTRLLCPWNLPGKNTGMGCAFLLQGIFPILGLNLGVPHCTQFLYHLSHQGIPASGSGSVSHIQLFLTPWTVAS